MAADLAGDQWNEGDVSCSVVRRVVMPDAFYVIDGLLHTFMTILQEFGIFEDEINAELNENLPLLATTKILMECVKAGMGREAAHELIKKHSTMSKSYFLDLTNEKNFPLTLRELEKLIEQPGNFSGSAVAQSKLIQSKIKVALNNKITNFVLHPIR
jgi:adenylosuccinate lyase